MTGPSGAADRSAALRRMVRLTARSSAVLFAGSQAASLAGGRPAKAARPLYVLFLLAHAGHFTVVARYAARTGGRDLFPGPRSLPEVGGWSTVLSIYSLFAGLAFAGWPTTATARPPGTAAGRVATGAIGALFAGTYAGLAMQRRRTVASD